MCRNFLFLIAELGILFIFGINAVSITELRVPHYVRNGTGSAAILDCMYSLRPEEQSADSGLVIKWFFNKSPNAVYQWIYNQKPQGLGILSNRLMLDYRATDHNTTAYRALYIKNPTTELTGEYKCLVSTNMNEDWSVKKMIVYAPEKQMDVFHTRYDQEHVNVTCRAIGVFPEPTLILYNDTVRFQDAAIISTARANTYDVLTYVLVHDSELSSPTTIDCELNITNTPYTKRKTLHYYPGSTESLSSISDSAVQIRKHLLVLPISFVLSSMYSIHF